MGLRELIIWLRRCHHSRGFGIQSPTDYRFVRYVINEHYPYYAYADIKTNIPNGSYIEHKLGKLYLRISNFLQPETICLLGGSNTYLNISYLTAGCKNTKIINEVFELKCRIDLIVSTLPDNFDSWLSSLSNYIQPDTVLVIEGINKDKDSKQRWNNLISDKRTIISFDLYYAGIIFFDNKRYKQHYMINF